jgi:signal peptidase II
MFYFPLLRGTYPQWVPFLKGQYFEFFQPVFNLADASISVGVILILIFQKHYFKQEVPEVSSPHSEVVEE